ncbi:MAG: FkbM family methyltransferase [Geminicoccaceae bacterium]
MRDEASLRAEAAALGYRLVRQHKVTEPWAQLALALTRQRIDAVLDVGANVGQFAGYLRREGWTGPIVSFEPIPEAHAELVCKAAADPEWQVAPRCALADRDGTAVLEVSAESDMSSLLPQAPLLRSLSPSSAVTRRIEVPLARLDGVAASTDPRWQRLFLKIDVQGGEDRVLAGAEGLWPRIAGVQVELSLIELYRGERPWRETLDGLMRRGFEPHLWLPGYFSRQLARQLQVDVVLFRPDATR